MNKLIKFVCLVVFVGMMPVPAAATWPGVPDAPDQMSIREKVLKKVDSSVENFFSAIKRGDAVAFSKLLDADPSLLRAKDERGFTPLMAVCSYAADPNYQGSIPNENYSEMVLHMLRLKVDVNAKNDQGVTALMLAASSNDLDIVRFLLVENNKSNVNAKDNFGRTALFYALDFRNSYRGKSKEEQIKLLQAQEAIVYLLLNMEDGAKANIVSNDGRTPLMVATEYLAYLANTPSHYAPDEKDNLQDLQRRQNIVRHVVHALHDEGVYK